VNPSLKLGMLSPLRREVWARDNGCCVLCGVACKRQKDDRYDLDDWLGEIDHIVPRSEGGLSVLENLRLLCKGCNRQKAGKEGKHRRVA
jgi:5-methylcytosine-specific restriction endonuclease McrA